MKVEVNQTAIKSHPGINVGGSVLMVPPPVGENYWLMRVPLSDKQAIVCFPKFGTIGIGFQHEEDWNTNLPFRCSAEEIFNHIKHNKGDESIKDGDCIAAIVAIQDAITNLKNNTQ